MRPDNVDNIYPLTPMQNLMLTHSISLPGSFALSNQFCYRIDGELDPARLERCLAVIQQRHQALRTFFLWDDLQEPLQLVHSRPPLRFEYVDLDDGAASDERLAALVAEDRARPFDLKSPALSRFLLVRLGRQLHQLIWSRHHLILDRWCVDILFDELFALYDTDDAAVDSLAQSGAFSEYVAWIGRQDDGAATRYWRSALAGIETPTLVSGTGRARSGYAVRGLPWVEETLPGELHESLRALARTKGVSLAVVLQAGLALQLARRNGTQDALFGLTVSGRPSDLPGVESIMGSFINNVPARIPVPGQLPLANWFKSIQSAQAERNRYEYLSPVDIRGASELKPGLPSFDVLALLHSPPVETRRSSRFEIEQLPGPIDSTHPFTLSLAESQGALRLTAAYDPERMSDAFARAMLTELRGVLAAFVAAPDALVGEVSRAGAADAASAQAAVAADTIARPVLHVESDALSGDAAVLADIWCRTLGVEHVGLDDDFFALGGTSLQAVEAFAQIEQRLGKLLPISLLFESGSIRSLLETLEQPLPPPAPAMIEMQRHGGRPPLFVVPGVGGDAVALSALARVLGPTQPFLGFHSRGLDGNAQPLTSIEEIAALNVREMSRIGNVPFMLCGVCWGALVALDMAQRLRAEGREPNLLIVVDPSHRTAGSVTTAAHDPRLAAARFTARRLTLFWTQFRDSDSRGAWLAQKFKALAAKFVSGDPLEGNRSEINRDRVMSANIKAQLSYTPARYDGPVHALLTAGRESGPADPRREWLQRVAPDAPVSYVPGFDTGDALSGNNVGVFAQKIHTLIETRAQPPN